MLTFKQYIDEVARDIERATKLGTYLAKRHTPEGGRHLASNIRFKGHDVHANNEKAEEGAEKLRKVQNGLRALHFDENEVSHIKVDSLHPTQDDTAFYGHIYKDFKSKDTHPIRVVKHEGKHYIWDGHHRWIDHKLRGKETIAAHVMGADLD